MIVIQKTKSYRNVISTRYSRDTADLLKFIAGENSATVSAVIRAFVLEGLKLPPVPNKGIMPLDTPLSARFKDEEAALIERLGQSSSPATVMRELTLAGLLRYQLQPAHSDSRTPRLRPQLLQD